jgi:hypothetical protein
MAITSVLIDPALQQQDLYQGAGAGGVSVGLAGCGPERFVDGGEPYVGFGRGKGGRACQGARSGLEDLQVVIEFVAVVVTLRQPRVWRSKTSSSLSRSRTRTIRPRKRAGTEQWHCAW